jgi:hypothetical protein
MVRVRSEAYKEQQRKRMANKRATASPAWKASEKVANQLRKQAQRDATAAERAAAAAAAAAAGQTEQNPYVSQTTRVVDRE